MGFHSFSCRFELRYYFSNHGFKNCKPCSCSKSEEKSEEKSEKKSSEKPSSGRQSKKKSKSRGEVRRKVREKVQRKAQLGPPVQKEEQVQRRRQKKSPRKSPAKSPARAASPKRRASPKKKASPKRKKSGNNKKPAAHPSYKEMIVAAITALKQRGGSSRQAISKYIASNYKGVSDNNNAHLRLAIRRALASGMLIQATNHANPFRLSDAAKKPAAKPKVVKKKPAAKKAKKPKTA